MHPRPQTPEEWLIYFDTRQEEILKRIDGLPCPLEGARLEQVERWQDRVNTGVKLAGKAGGLVVLLSGLFFTAWKAIHG